MNFRPPFPAVLSKIYSVVMASLRYDPHLDFEPYEEFSAAEYTEEWIRSWTHNDSLDTSVFLPFGQDGSGGLVCFWLTAPEKNIEQQPIIFLDSEGGCGVVAQNLSDFVWLIAQGLTLWYVVDQNVEKVHPFVEIPALMEVAKAYCTTDNRDPQVIVAEANAAFPEFKDHVSSLESEADIL